MLNQQTIPMKICSKCKHPKTWGHFYTRYGKPNGWCKECYANRNPKTPNSNLKHFLTLVEVIKELYQTDEFLDLPFNLFPKFNETLKELQKEGLI